MRRIASGLGLTFRYWMQTEVHVYAFSVAANVLLSFFPFLIIMLSLLRQIFGEQAAVGAIDLALRDHFPDALGQFLVISVLLLQFTANGIFEPLEVGLNRNWGICKNRAFFHNQIVSFGLIFICGSLALGSMMMTALPRRRLGGVLYVIDDAAKLVGVTRIAYRREIYE
jgi:uncharacterized BrkB/YihY/UPF0761 family membrane protein